MRLKKVMKQQIGDLVNGSLNFDPTKNDFLFKFFSRLLKSDPIPPVLAGVVYFLISSGGTIFLGYFTDSLFGQNTKLTPIASDYMNIINFGIIAPIGAGLFINLYNKMKSAFIESKNNKIITNIYDYNKLLLKLVNLYSRKEVVYSALAVSILLNIFFMLKKIDNWSGINGGITAIYFRLFVIINYYMILIVIYKCIITTWAMREIFKLNFIVQPLHPDKCGGLKAIGDLSIAMHYFLQLIIIFLTIIVIFNPGSLHNFVFVFSFFTLVSVTIFSLFFSLYKAHFKMREAKNNLLTKLHIEFQKNYDSLFNMTFREEIANNLQSINNLYTLTEKMPIWPFDIHSLIRFFSAVSIPIFIFMVEMLSNTDSIIYNLDKLNIFKYLIK